MMTSSYNEFRSIPSSLIFWKTLCQIGIISSIKCLQNSAVNPFGPGVFFVGRFLATESISLVDVGLHRLPISS